MANIKSAIKRIKQNEKKRIQNRIVRGRVRSVIKDARTELLSNDPEAAEKKVLLAISSLDKAATKKVIHKNNAARKKSRMMKRLAAMNK